MAFLVSFICEMNRLASQILFDGQVNLAQRVKLPKSYLKKYNAPRFEKVLCMK